MDTPALTEWELDTLATLTQHTGRQAPNSGDGQFLLWASGAHIHRHRKTRGGDTRAHLHMLFLCGYAQEWCHTTLTGLIRKSYSWTPAGEQRLQAEAANR